MNDRDVERILMVVSQADGGCSSCAYDLLQRLGVAIPEVDWASRWNAIPSAGKDKVEHYARLYAWRDRYTAAFEPDEDLPEPGADQETKR